LNESAPPNAPSVMRKLTAILSADVKGYSRLMSVDEVTTIRRLADYRSRMTQLIEKYRGRVIDAPGDNLLADFGSAVDALQSAVDVQRELKLQNDPLAVTERMEYRIGINVGDVIVEGDRIYGDGVNIAARLEALAEGGGICVSSAVYEQVENKLPLQFLDLGEQSFKNIARPIRAFRVITETTDLSAAAAPAEFPAAPLVMPDKPSIVVLPFLNSSGDPEQEYFSDGISEDLITDLSKISGLFVISRNSAFQYKGTTTRPDTISKELGVRYLLEGSVRKANKRVRITAQLSEAATSYQLWSERYDRELEDVFAVQDEVTQKIVAALQVTLTQGEQASIGNAPTGSLEAYDCFLRGLERHGQRARAANLQARQLFERALELDPRFAAACAMLGRTYLTALAFQWEDRDQASAQLFSLAARAVALDDTLSIAFETLAYAHLGAKEHAQAIVAAQRAVELDPNSADALETLGEILCFAGRAHEALPYIEQAMRLNPRYPPSYLWGLGQTYYFIGRTEEAIATFNRVITRNPDHVTAHFMLAVIYSEAGRAAAARTEYREILRISPHFTLANVRERVPYQNQDTVARIVTALQEAVN
jgi:adenylate cyclase